MYKIDEAIKLPNILKTISFNIVFKKGCSLSDGAILEHIGLCKESAEDVIKLYWSVGFGYS